MYNKEIQLYIYVNVYRYLLSRQVASDYIYIYIYILIFWASLKAQMAKNLPTMQETQVWSLGQEDPLEEVMATHPSILAWRIP